MSLVRRAAVIATLGALAGFAAGGVVVAQRWYRSWGTTADEKREALPGDAAVPDPQVSHTLAVTIDALPEDVWPWIVQLGTGRGGWYSYDWVENAMGLDVKTLHRIVPELQELHEGDLIPVTPDMSFPVKRVERPRLLLLEGHDPKAGDASWLFLLRETGDGATRLITRSRTRWPVSGAARAYIAAFDPGIFMMERKMLLEIKRLAEQLARERMPAVEPQRVAANGEAKQPAPVF